MRGVLAARTVTLFTTNVPLGDFLCLDVVVNRMAAVAKRAGWTLEVVGRI